MSGRLGPGRRGMSERRAGRGRRARRPSCRGLGRPCGTLPLGAAGAQRRPRRRRGRPTGRRRAARAAGLGSTCRRAPQSRCRRRSTPRATTRARLRRRLIETAARVSADETQIAETQALRQRRPSAKEAVKRSLDGRRAVIAEVLAALQRMGRKPPPALLVDPDDVLKAIRTSMLLGAVLPGMRADVDALAADLAELAARAHGDRDRAAHLADDLAALGAERARLAALIEARQAALGRRRRARRRARQRAGARRQASSLKDLIGRMEAESRPAADAAEAARRATRRRGRAGRRALPPCRCGGSPRHPARDPARLAPAVAFASLKGALPLPVAGTPCAASAGRRVRRHGEGHAHGRRAPARWSPRRATAGSPTPAPTAAFGQLLILNAGSGYYIVLAGMDRINVDLGQFVLAGEPVAAMGDGSTKTAAAMALGAAQPILYVEFRKDGATIDPGPWWAKPELQKVRG